MIAFVRAVCEDMTSGDSIGHVNSVMKYLFPNLEVDTTTKQQYIKGAPLNTSTNEFEDISNGVAHCLVYGYHELDIEDNQDEDEDGEEQDEQNGEKDEQQQNRGRARQRAPVSHRVALNKRRQSSGSRSTSRSPVRRSPIRRLQPQPLDIDMEHVLTGLPPVDDRQVLDNPGDFVVHPENHGDYFECHRPDLMIIETKYVPSLDPPPAPQREEACVKVVIELATTEKFRDSSLAKAMRLKHGAMHSVMYIIIGL